MKRVLYPGGNAVNVAVLAGRYGAKAAYLGSLGMDARGQLIRDSLTAEGVDISHCQYHTDVENAFAEVDLVDGDRVFGNYSSGAAAQLKLSATDLDYMRTFDVVHSSIYSYLENQKDALRSASRWLSFDFSSHLEEMDLIRAWLPYVNLAIISLSDYPETDVMQIAQDFKNSGPDLVLVTKGQQGSWLWDGRSIYHQEMVTVEAVDTMGAGDAYVAAFLVEYFAGKNIPAAMQCGAEYAAKNCMHSGAFGYGQLYPRPA